MYLNESPFWYFLAVKVSESVENDISPNIKYLNERVTKLGLSIKYETDKTIAWATICQLYLLNILKVNYTGRFALAMMLSGFGHRFNEKGFPKNAFYIITENCNSSPHLMGRILEEKITSTFIVNAFASERLTHESKLTNDTTILKKIFDTCENDFKLLSLGMEAITPQDGIWEGTVEEYSKRRPSFWRRTFTHMDNWLFD